MTGSTSPVSSVPLGVVLAAGRGVRFGGTKQLASLAGEPLVAHVVRSVTDAGLDVLVVTGADGDQVAAAARTVAPDLVVAHNPDPGQGMGSSLAAAARAAGPRALVVVLGDQPGLPSVDVARVAAVLAAGEQAVRTGYPAGGFGHPTGFGAGLHDDLLALSDEGAGRELLVAHDAVAVDVDHARPPDVDTPEDLAALAAVWEAGDAAGRSSGSGASSGSSPASGPGSGSGSRSDPGSGSRSGLGDGA